MKRMRWIPFFLLFFVACADHHEGSEEQLIETVDSFAVSYFNYDFRTAQRFVTEESKTWLRYAASNVHQEDIDILRQQEEPATIEINSFDYPSEQEATILVTVNNYLRMDTVGTVGHIREKDRFTLHAEIKNGKWFVRMEDLPRNEKRSHD